jgi:hypothetical protein
MRLFPGRWKPLSKVVDKLVQSHYNHDYYHYPFFGLDKFH